MTFLAIIAAVLLLQVWGTAERVHIDSWFANWQTRVTAWGLPGGISLALLVLLPSLLAIFALSVIQPILFGLLWLLLATLLLLYAFGRGDFQALMGRYRSHAYSGDFEAAYLSACTDFDWENSDEAPDTALEVHARVQQALLYEGLQRWFAVLLYFVLLGPAAALAYRLLQLCRGTIEPALVERCLFLLDWIPSRLLAATFVLTGDFIGSRVTLLAALQDRTEGAGKVLYAVGLAALGSGLSGSTGDEETFGPEAAAQNREFDALLSRSAVCWIVAFSLLVLLF